MHAADPLVPTRPRHVAYVMSRFPKITETFILREMLALERDGWRVEPFALIREREQVAHAGLASILSRTTFAGSHRARMLRAVLGALVRRPRRLLCVLARTVAELWRAPGFLLRALASLPPAIYWAELARTRGVRHIHAHFATHAAYIAYVMSALGDIPFSFTAHAHDMYQQRAMLGEKMRAASVVVTISEYNRTLLGRLFPASVGKVVVVRGGVDLDRFAFRPRAVHDGPLRVLAVGRLQEYKGMPYLVEACRLLRRDGIAFACTIAGDGPQRAMLAAAIARAGLDGGDPSACVRLVGWQPDPMVAEHLRAADVFVLPSVIAANGMMEGLPVVLMEAMSCGLPVVSTTISGIPELVRDGENGLLVPPRDAGALAAALARLAPDASLRDRMGRAGRALVERDYDLTRNTRAKAALYEQHLAAAGD